MSTARPRIGVVMLDTHFPRLPGDIGNRDSFACAVDYERATGADVAAVVTRQALEETLVARIVDAARALRRRGATLIGTSCGFLASQQQRLETLLDVPVLTSSLCLLPALRARLGADAPIGVLTFSTRRLVPHHFGGAHDGHLIIEGLADDAHLAHVIGADLPALDAAQAERDVLAAARRLRARSAQPAAVVLECTNLGPWRRRIGACLGAPVYDLVGALNALAGGEDPIPARGHAACPASAPLCY